jgi:hypothetical protein
MRSSDGVNFTGMTVNAIPEGDESHLEDSEWTPRWSESGQEDSEWIPRWSESGQEDGEWTLRWG